MSEERGELAVRIAAQAAAAGFVMDRHQAERCAGYLQLLAKWNRTINLTALPVDPPTHLAIEKLILESVGAAALLPDRVMTAFDLGSGGGSPALPLKIFRPQMNYSLVESRSRKCAFLREAVRSLGLDGVRVLDERFEVLRQQPAFVHVADLVTFRAVRADAQFWLLVERLLSESGSVLWFGAKGTEVPPWLRQVSRSRLGESVLLMRSQ